MHIALLRTETGKQEASVPRPNWGSKAIFATVDQGLFSGSNFIVSVLLARWLSPESYGAFTVAYSVFLLGSTFHTEILTSPMLVFGAGKYAEQFRKYLGLLLRGHGVLTATMSFVLLIAAGIFWSLGSTNLAVALLGFGIITPFILLVWLARSAFYVRLQPEWAVVGGALYLLMMTAGMYVLYKFHHLVLLSALGVIGFTNLCVGALLIALLKPEYRRASDFFVVGEGKAGNQLPTSGNSVKPAAQLKEGQRDRAPATVLHDHFRYAKWSLAASITAWAGANVHYFVLSSTAGLRDVAAMRILDTMLLPFFLYQTAISRIFVPILGARTSNPHAELLPYGIRIMFLWALQAFAMYVLLGLFSANIILTLYGSAYVQYSHFLVWYGFILIPEAAITVLLSLLRVLVRTDLIFLYYLLLSASLLMGFLVAAKHGLPGIIVARIVLTSAMLPIGVFFARAACGAHRIS